jgi:hypothetical protein
VNPEQCEELEIRKETRELWDTISVQTNPFKECTGTLSERSFRAVRVGLVIAVSLVLLGGAVELAFLVALFWKIFT